MSHHSPHNSPHYTRGSILIWSVMLGFVLTSVFFFFGMRQRAMVSVQRDTTTILNTRAYLESYANYIETLDLSELNNLKSSGIDFDNGIITGTITNEVSEINGMIDVGSSTSYTFSGNIYVEWSKCPDDLKGGVLINDVPYSHDSGVECGPSETYDDVAGAIAVTDPVIKTQNTPFNYRITPGDGSTQLVDNQWHLEISSELDYGKVITVKRTFEK